jgi:hypothetical protein
LVGLVFYPEDGGKIFFRNAGKLVPNSYGITSQNMVFKEIYVKARRMMAFLSDLPLRMQRLAVTRAAIVNFIVDGRDLLLSGCVTVGTILSLRPLSAD